MKYIIKRDGRKVAFNENNILRVVKKAINSVHEHDTLSKSECELAKNLTKDVLLELNKSDKTPTVEGVQDLIQEVLIRNSLINEAKNFIEYRQKRTAARGFNDDLIKTYRKMTISKSTDMDLMRENANINGDTTMGLMLRFGSEACKDFALKYVLKPEWAYAHKNGDFHMHDLDFSRFTWNCCQIDLAKLFKNGFSTGHGYLRDPSGIRAAGSLACIAIQSNQNDMFGGQSIAKFDYDLAPYVAKSYAKNLIGVLEDVTRTHLDEKSKDSIKDEIKNLYYSFNQVTKNTIFGDNIPKLKQIIAKHCKSEDVDYVYQRAYEITDEETHQSMEAVIHNLNTMQCLPGNQKIQVLDSDDLEIGVRNGSKIVDRDIKDVKVDDYVLSYNIETKNFEFKKVLKVFNNGNQDVFEFKLEDGDTFRCTLDHKVLTRDGTYQPIELVKEVMVDKDELVKITSKEFVTHETVYDIEVEDNHNFILDIGVIVSNCRAGAQTPFSSINYGTCVTEEGRMVIKNILKATWDGLGRHETPIFPVQIFKVKKGVNLEDNTPNHDLFELACKVTAKRLFPNFEYIDSPMNLQFYKEGRPETEIATMGAAKGDETVTIKVNDVIYNNIKIKDAFNIIREYTKKTYGGKGLNSLKPFKNKCGVYKISHKNDGFYYIGSSKDIKRRLIEHRYSIKHRGTLGEWYKLNDFNPDNYSFTLLEECSPDYLWETESKYIDLKDVKCVNFKDSLNNGNFYKDSGDSVNAMNNLPISKIPNNLKSHCWYRHLENSDVFVLSRNQFEPVRAIIYNDKDVNLRLFKVTYLKNNKEYSLYLTEDHPLHTNYGRVETKDLKVGYLIFDSKTCEPYAITRVEELNERFETYDFEVDNDLFDLSGIVSHNCRTRVIANHVHPEDAVVTGRGNFTFTTINLPRLGITSKGDWKVFYEKLDNLMQMARDQIKERFENICKRHVYNYPFLLGQNIWIHSEDLNENDEVRKILDESSLSIGFIGLAECLTAMTGKHHGESEESNRLGHEILDHMSKNLARYIKEDNLNWSLFATPAEGLSGRFVRIDKKIYGVIPGVTDKDYYTNSFHIPPKFNISAEQKMRIEGPYHEQCTAGAISYVEIDGDPLKNVKAVEKLVKFGLACNMTYFSINHAASDYCPVCGYTGIIDDVCPKCGRHNKEAVSVEKLRSCGCDVSEYE